jgi:tetratricopeptide (TPR) repeat protein
MWRGHFSEGRTWLEQALAISPQGPIRARVIALSEAGDLAYQQDDSGAAARFATALSLARELGDRQLISLNLSGLGNLALINGNLDQAAAAYGEQLVLDQERGDQQELAGVLSNLSIVAARQGNLGRAADLLDEAASLGQGLSAGVMTTVLSNRGHIKLAQGKWTEAVGDLCSSLSGSLAGGLRAGSVFEALAGLAAVAEVRGQYERAARLFGAIDVLVANLGASLDPIFPDLINRAVTGTRDALRVESFARHHTAGAALTLEEAVAEALALADEITGEAMSER